jgi:hypothetical protein
VTGLITQVALIFYPLFRSWTLQKLNVEMVSPLPRSVESFETFLRTPEGFNAFYDFASGEFSVGMLTSNPLTVVEMLTNSLPENLVFCKNVLSFKQKFARLETISGQVRKAALESDIYNHAVHIFVTHITRNAPLQVNLPSTVVDAIVNRLKTQSTGMAPDHFALSSFSLICRIRFYLYNLCSSILTQNRMLPAWMKTNPEAQRSMEDITELQSSDSEEEEEPQIPRYVSVKMLPRFESNVPSLDNIYDRAYQVIIELMYTDSFRRFRNTTSFRNLKEHLEKNQAIHGALKSLNML